MVKFSDQVQWAFSRTLGKSEAGILLGFSTTYIAEQGFCQVLHTRKYRLDMNKIGKTPIRLKPGVTDLFETASYILCTDWCKGLLVWYKLMK